MGLKIRDRNKGLVDVKKIFELTKIYDVELVPTVPFTETLEPWLLFPDKTNFKE